MKKHLILKILLGVMLLHASLALVFAQENVANAAPNQSETQVLGENERIPFMQAEEATRQQDATSGSIIVRTLGALILIVGLVFFGAWGMKKLGFGVSSAKSLSDAPDLSVLSSVSLGSGRTISTVKFGEKVLLVGSTAQAFTLLAEDWKADDGEDFGANPRSVAELLADENFDFETEFSKAQNRLQITEEKGELFS